MRHVEFRHIFMCGYVLKLVYAGLRPADATPFFFSIGAALSFRRKETVKRVKRNLVPCVRLYCLHEGCVCVRARVS